VRIHVPICLPDATLGTADGASTPSCQPLQPRLKKPKAGHSRYLQI